MRQASLLLQAALADPTVELTQVDLFTVQLVDGTTYHWASYDLDLTVGGNTYTSAGPFIRFGDLSVSNTMVVPTLSITILATPNSFAGGIDLMSQAHDGLFDGCVVSLQRLFMPRGTTDVSLGTVQLFTGQSGPVDIDGSKITLKVKGANNLLNQYAPRNVYQAQCIHAFCDPGCTLLRATFTASFAVGTSPAPSRTFIPWASAPGSPGLYQLGTVTFTTGVASGSRRTVEKADATGLTLTYPLYNTPATGDGFTAFQGCDKSQTICTSRSNLQNWRGFPYVPPATTGV